MSVSCLVLELTEEFWMVVLSTNHFTKHYWKANWNYHLQMATNIFLMPSIMTKHLPFKNIFSNCTEKRNLIMTAHFNKHLSTATQIIENIIWNQVCVFHTALGGSLDNNPLWKVLAAYIMFYAKKCPSTYCNDTLSVVMMMKMNQAQAVQKYLHHCRQDTVTSDTALKKVNKSESYFWNIL